MHEFVRDPMTGINRERSKLGSSGSNRNIGSENSISSRTKSIAGTLEYMAPEIIIMLGKRTVHEDGYTAAVDYWSLGVLIYKLLTGNEPYNKTSKTVVQALLPTLFRMHNSYKTVFETIFGVIDYEICGNILTEGTCSILHGLLAFNAENRLGYNADDMKAGHDALMNHAFFSGIDWTLLESKQVPPPYIPKEEILEIMREDSTAVPKTISEILREANKNNWCEEFTLLSSTINNVGSPGTSVTSKSRLKIRVEEQHYFNKWNYVNPQLIILQEISAQI